MSILILGLNKPKNCASCHRSKRIDNGHVVCASHPDMEPIADGDSIPDYCGIRKVVLCRNCKYGILKTYDPERTGENYFEPRFYCHLRDGVQPVVKYNDFCSFGKSRE